MADKVLQGKPKADDPEFVAVLIHRAQKKIPNWDSAEEINLVPYLDVMVNLIIFMIVTISAFIPLGILSINPPSAGSNASAGTPEAPPLTLTVFITHEGFTIAGSAGAMAPIPMRAGEYDFAALTSTAETIKVTWPNERQVIIAADKDIKYDILVHTMDALRTTPKGDKLLFDTVMLSTGVRTGG